MLQRRSSIISDVDKANKALAKAKPNKVAVAKMLRDDKDQELESCTKLASLEVRRFHQQRLFEMKETLVQVPF
jgi:ribosomal protein L30E